MENEDKVTRLGKDYCPTCNYMMDCATGTKEGSQSVPVPGDYSICLNCGEWLKYGEDMAVEKIPEVLRADIDPDNFSELQKHSFHIKMRGPLKK